MFLFGREMACSNETIQCNERMHFAVCGLKHFAMPIGVREGISLGERKKFALKITICPKKKQFALKLTFYFNPNGKPYVNLCYTAEFVYNGFLCNVNSPIMLQFVWSRWHLLHAFQFVYNVNSAIMFIMQSPRGGVIDKFCSYLACQLKGLKLLACCVLPDKTFYGNCFYWYKYVTSLMQWAWIASIKAMVSKSDRTAKAVVPDRTVWLPIPAWVIAAVRLSKALKTRTKRSQAICTSVLIASKTPVNQKNLSS